MGRLPRAILVLFTCLAAFAATSLQGKVLCYSDCGRHFAFEAPHSDNGCPGGHEGHDHPAPDSESKGCTDVSADFPVIREAAKSSFDTHHAKLAALATGPVIQVVSLADHFFRTPVGVSHGPLPPGLACLRTIVLLV